MPPDPKLKALLRPVVDRGRARPQSIWGSLRSAVEVGLFTAIAQRLARWLSLMRWVFSSFNKAVVGPRSWRRLLLIYDLESQSFTVGDILEFQGVAAALRERWGLEKIDYAVIHEGNTAKDAATWSAEGEKFHFRLNQVLPSAQVNEHFGSIFVFDSHAQFDDFLGDNVRRYQAWPPGATYKLGKNLRYRMYNEVLYDYVQEHGRLPLVRSRPAMAAWARDFAARHALPEVMVSINMRNNPRWEPSRNLDVPVWVEFFESCRGVYPVRFVLTCAREEIDPRFRTCPNVVLAKDFDTNVEQDCALLEVAAFNMGASSGLCAKVIFGDAPYCIVRTDISPEAYRGMTVQDGHYRFYGARPDQRFWPIPETLDLLKNEFARMWSALDANAWRATITAPTPAQASSR